MNKRDSDQKTEAAGGATARPLGGLRVLELGDQVSYAGHLLAQQGAEVTLIEPPGGFASRARPPFLDDIAGPDRSLSFHYFNAGKRSVVVDRAKASGREHLRAMLLSADVALDDQLQQPWAADALDYETLKQANPRLIWCAVTSFGQTGPHAHYKGDDFICMAAGGMTQLAGYNDLGPFTSPGDIAVKSSGAFAAVAIMLALHARDQGNEGQFIDVSMQEVVALGTETAPQFFDMKKSIRRRLPRPQRQAGIGYYPCADGYVMVYAAEAGVGTGWTRLVDWMVERKTPGADTLAGEAWLTNSFKARKENTELFAKLFLDFAMPLTKQELFQEGQRRRIAITPVNTGADLVADRHLKTVGTLSQVSECGSRPVIGPAAAVVMSATPFMTDSPAPQLAETVGQTTKESVPA
jgi:benzylsuccinate CoA-transferase BbsE subunit